MRSPSATMSSASAYQERAPSKFVIKNAVAATIVVVLETINVLTNGIFGTILDPSNVASLVGSSTLAVNPSHSPQTHMPLHHHI